MPDELRIEWMRLDDLVPARRNSKVHDLNELDTSIDELGFITELKVDERTGELHAGNGRRDDLRRKRDRGEAAPDGIKVADDGEWLAPVVRGWSSRDEHHATAAAVAVNHVGKRAGFDDAVLLDELSDLAADAPNLLAATGHTSDDLDRLLEAASGGATITTLDGLGTVLIPAGDGDPFGRPSYGGDLVEDRGGDLDDVGSTRDEDGPGPLDVLPAWRTLQPWRAVYHSGTPEGAEAVRIFLRDRTPAANIQRDLSVSWITPDGDEYLPPGKWLTIDGQTGAFDVWTRDEFADRFVAANEPARRAMRDAAPIGTKKATIPSGAELLRHGRGLFTGADGRVAPAEEIPDEHPS